MKIQTINCVDIIFTAAGHLAIDKRTSVYSQQQQVFWPRPLLPSDSTEVFGLQPALYCTSSVYCLRTIVGAGINRHPCI